MHIYLATHQKWMWSLAKILSVYRHKTFTLKLSYVSAHQLLKSTNVDEPLVQVAKG